VPHHGIGYGVLRYLAEDRTLLCAAEGEEAGVVEYNYLGQFDQVINAQTRFQAAPEYSGAQSSARRRRTARLGLTGQVFGGELLFGLNYSGKQYEEATMRRLSSFLEEGLSRVIAHCATPGVGGYTPSDFPLAKVSQERLDAWQREYPGLSRVYPATPMQAGLLFESLITPSTYVGQTFPVLRGELDTAVFRAAWQHVVDRHDVFRTVFAEAEMLEQLVVAHSELPWHEEDWRDLDESTQLHRFERYRAEDRKKAFDFRQAPLMRIALFRLGDDRYQMLWTLHHILIDGWCIPLVYRDVMRFYLSKVEGRTEELPAPPPYQDYIAWLQRQPLDIARTHWHSQIGDIEAPTPLVIDRLGNDGERGHRDQTIDLSLVQTQALQAAAQNLHVTMSTLVQWAWGYLLHCYSGERSVVFGATISGRPAEVAGIEEMVGMFINAIPVRISFDGEDVAKSIRELHDTFQRSNEYGYLSLPEMQRQSGVRAGTPLFESLTEFGNYPLDAMTDPSAMPTKSRLEIERRGHDEQSNYKLGLNAYLGRTLRLKLGYRAEYFTYTAIERLLEHLGRIFDCLPGLIARSGEFCTLPGPIETATLKAWGRGAEVTLPEKCTHSLFEAVAERTPDAVALVFDNQHMTYAEVEAEANRIAHYLIGNGVGRDMLVGLCTERSCDTIVGMLGILKSGAAYLPLDPTYPEERIAYMLKDSCIEHVLVHSAVLEALPALGERTVLPLDAEIRSALLAGLPATRPQSGVKPSDLAYAIYTSGSSGMPKCALLEHRSAVNLALSQRELFEIEPSSRVLAFASIAFDAATWEWLMALSHGASLHICQQEDRFSAERLSSMLVNGAITHATLPPALLAQMDPSLDYAFDVLILAGEACDEQLAWRWAERFDVRNAYGPTETTVCATQSQIMPGERITLGQALPNFELAVVDERLELQPIGIAGELCLGGIGLARGYLWRNQLTEDRFVANPRRTGGRLYRTGDLVRWLPDGGLQFIGRIDDQIKIRGFRVELGEVEAAVVACDGIREAKVVARRDDTLSDRLVAYVVTDSSGIIEGHVEMTQIRAWSQQLKKRLPDYMVPSAFVVLDEIPMTANGKIDRQRLPEPEYSAHEDFVEPITDTERELAALWSRILNFGVVGATQNFFDIGGDSIQVMRMSMELKTIFNVEIPVRDIFEGPTVRLLATRIDEIGSRRALKGSLMLDVEAAEGSQQELIEL
jgi:amino acid adenylation domain-containing protein/non-ribosomal peptide synthase protein (TIGR01720 family)